MKDGRVTDGGDEHQRVVDVGGGGERDAERWKEQNAVQMRYVTYQRWSQRNRDRHD